MRVEGWMFGVAILTLLALVVIGYFRIEGRLNRGLDELAFTPRFGPDIPCPACPYDREIDDVEDLVDELLLRVALA